MMVPPLAVHAAARLSTESAALSGALETPVELNASKAMPQSRMWRTVFKCGLTVERAARSWLSLALYLSRVRSSEVLDGRLGLGQPEKRNYKADPEHQEQVIHG
jgi:hypothetical protein